MISLLHSETFRKNLSKWIFMYVAVMCLLTSVITYSKYISSFGADDEARTSKFNVKIEPSTLGTETSCIESTEEGKGTAPTILCTTGTSRPTALLEYYFKVDVTEIEVRSEIHLRARAGDENYKTSNKNLSNLIIQELKVCKDMTCTDFDQVQDINAQSGTIKIDVDGKDKNKKNIYYFKVTAKYDPSKLNKDVNGFISFTSDEDTPVTDEVRIGFSAMQVE